MAPSKLVCVLLLSIVTVMSRNVEATWCVAKTYASPVALKTQLDFACANGADCGPIKPGGICFEPNNMYNHASYAFNSYYQHKGKNPSSCNFGGNAAIAFTDPSFRKCVYPGSQRTDAPTPAPAMNIPNVESLRVLNMNEKMD